MRTTLALARRATYADYLAVEQLSAHRHEYLDGVIVAMAGGSDEHNAIAARLTICVGVQLGRGCRYYTADQRFWIPAHGRARYSDGSVICGAPVHPKHDGQATTNPRIVLEVLSPSSEGDDHGDKRLDFQTLPALEAYVLASQDARQIEIWRRSPAGWSQAPEVHLDGASFSLPGLVGEVAVASVYDGILDPSGRSLLR